MAEQKVGAASATSADQTKGAASTRQANQPAEADWVKDIAAAGEGEPAIEAPTAPAPVPFLQTEMAQNVVPFATSLLIHIAILLIGWATFQAVRTFTDNVKQQSIIPDAEFTEGPIGGIPNPGLGGDPTRAAAQDQFAESASDSEGWAAKPNAVLEANLGGGGVGDDASSLAVGPGTSFGTGGGLGSGIGEGTGAGEGTGGGRLAPFGVPGGGGGVGPKAPFMGVAGQARNVAFVCDASGSMLGVQWDLLKIELNKAVQQLKPVQGYNIIFFQRGGFEAMSRDRLQVASADNKKRTPSFLENVTLGAESDPMPGLRFAFKLKPQMIYLLTDGAFRDENNADIGNAVKAEIQKLNPDKAVRVNTIGFFRPEQDEADRKLAEDVLRSIAQDNGGLFKAVMVTDLMK